jgi:molybdopterin-containing oxidoreductase family membrane subunit
MYALTRWDYAILAGSFGLFFTLFLLFVRVLPVVAISEVKGVMDPKVARSNPSRAAAAAIQEA